MWGLGEPPISPKFTQQAPGGLWTQVKGKSPEAVQTSFLQEGLFGRVLISQLEGRDCSPQLRGISSQGSLGTALGSRPSQSSWLAPSSGCHCLYCPLDADLTVP